MPLPIIITHSKSPKLRPMSTNIQQFKQQTFSLIKQQATRIKTHAKELEIKQQQIRLLKETIQVLEEERDQSQRVKNGYKMKIDVIMAEVAHYNDTVVQKLSQDNDYLGRKLGELTPNLEESLETVKRLTKQLQVSEQNNQKIAAQLAKSKENTNDLTKQLSKLKSQLTKLKDLSSEQQKHINKLEAHNEQLLQKQKSNEKHIDNMVQKCQETVNSCEKKLKNVKEGMVKKEEIGKVEAEVQRQVKKNEELRKEVDRLARQKNQLQFSIKILKEKQVSNLMKLQMESSLLEADIRSLKQSCKIGKRVSEFECKYADIFYQIVEGCLAMSLAKDEIAKKNQILEATIGQLEKVAVQRENALEQSKSELEIITHKLKSESQTIQSSYEGKILQLSIKIKKQQKALQELGIKDRQFESLTEQYDKLAEQHKQLKVTFENTVEQYKKENEKLTGEVQELIQLCDQNINTKNSLNCLKHAINNLLAVVYFLHLNLVRNREARRKVYQPFVQFYFLSQRAAENAQNPKQKGKKLLRKFRSCVTAIIALKRMQKGAQQFHGSGLLRYIQKALKYKGKIQNLNDFLQNLLAKAIKYEKNVDQLINETKSTYRWNCLPNYLKINIPVNGFKNFDYEGKV